MTEPVLWIMDLETTMYLQKHHLFASSSFNRMFVLRLVSERLYIPQVDVVFHRIPSGAGQGI